MISIVYDPNNEISSSISKDLHRQLSDQLPSILLQDLNQAFYFNSFSLLILSEKPKSLVVFSKYILLIIGQKDDLADYTSNAIGYNPISTYYLQEHEDNSQIFGEILEKVQKNAPKINGYKQVDYFIEEKVHTEEDKEFRVCGVRVLHDDNEYVAYDIEIYTDKEYKAACNVALYGENDDGLVEVLWSGQKYPEDMNFVIPGDKVFGVKMSMKDAFKYKVDLTGIVRKPVLKALSNFCVFEDDKKVIDFLTSLKGKDKFREDIESRYLSIPDILQIYNIRIPPGDLLQILDKSKPRMYTISSNPESSPTMHFAIQLIKHGKYIGHFSTFAEHLHRAQQGYLHGEIKPSAFSLQPKLPILMIGNGCGVAPFRGILGSLSSNPSPLSILICGFRTKKHFIYREDFEKSLKNPQNPLLEHVYLLNDKEYTGNCLDYMFVGYSRDGPKVYVQDIINVHKDLVWNILVSGLVYICGGNTMGKSVMVLLQGITKEFADEEMWKEVIKRIKMEVWG